MTLEEFKVWLAGYREATTSKGLVDDIIKKLDEVTTESQMIAANEFLANREAAKK